jgi:phosphoribosylformylglycinamidine synthase
MLTFFGQSDKVVFVLETVRELSTSDIHKLQWLFGNQPQISRNEIVGPFIGPRATMITPWSTNAVEITQNMDLEGILRIERYVRCTDDSPYDPMVSQKFEALTQEQFKINIEPAPVVNISDINAYNLKEGLALSAEEVAYLEGVSKKIGRPLTDSEVFGFSQVNSEHCRHKIFNGQFIIDGEEKSESLFQLIKKTSKANPNTIVSAYKDNVAFIEGPKVTQFAPATGEIADLYVKTGFDSVISLKAETHNFPTTVEAFNGAATGSGGEIRDRLAGGRGSIPLAGTALYMTPYSRVKAGKPWEEKVEEREWLYQTPLDILIKASNGASDFGNKFGQPLINGSLLTFEHKEDNRWLAYDKVIMMAGGIGYGKADQAQKDKPKKGDKIVLMGGDNYRIGMGGAAVSSAEGGEFSTGLELNAVQRSNPEMQKRAANAIRAMVESTDNPIVSIHDHGAGGHLNCLSELVEETGGKIELRALPVGDPTLSARELIGNESQERMGMIVSEKDLAKIKQIAERERAPIYEVGSVTGDQRFFIGSQEETPMDLALEDMFGSSPQTILKDQSTTHNYEPITYDKRQLKDYIKEVLSLEAVACKDWLTNKVDRCVGGRVAKQQCCGPLQLPLNNCGVMALDYDSVQGIATSMGHAPIIGLLDPVSGARMAITEALTNLVWAPLEEGLKSVALSANWMWPAKNEGENARLYAAVEEISAFAIALGINIPTGKDSLSMKQKYPDREVYSPGTVVISAVGHCKDITKVVEPVLKANGGDLYYINLSESGYALGGSSFAQTKNKIGSKAPGVHDVQKLADTFNLLQELIIDNKISAGHDISAGGLVTALLEMCFAETNLGAQVDLTDLAEDDNVKLLLSENAGLILQSTADLTDLFGNKNILCIKIGRPTVGQTLAITNGTDKIQLDVAELRTDWYETSYLLDTHQTSNGRAKERFDNYKTQPLTYKFPQGHSGLLPVIPNGKRPRAAVIREKGSNSERELAHAMYLAGFEVKDIHMTDLISGRENLEDVQFIGAVGGFSNSDVLGSAKGWAGAFMYNEKAKKALDNFFARKDVLSVGICNGCQLFMELELINPEHKVHGKMTYNESHKHESAFTSVDITENNSVMLSSLAGSRLGVWISHGEGKFVLPEDEDQYNIVAKYGYDKYPSNPNGSAYNTAMMCSADGRHLVMMPHIERSIFKWNWAYYPDKDEVISPWITAFVNAREWITQKNQ